MGSAALVDPRAKAHCVIAGWSREFRHPSLRALGRRAVGRRRTRGVEEWWGAIYAAAVRLSATAGRALPPHRGHSTRPLGSDRIDLLWLPSTPGGGGGVAAWQREECPPRS